MKVSRHSFEPLFPAWPTAEVPVWHVTNGVHMPTWDSAESDDLWTGSCGKDRWLGDEKDLEQKTSQEFRRESLAVSQGRRRSLVEYARKQLAVHFELPEPRRKELEDAGHLFNPDALTLGFARRFATLQTAKPASPRS